MPNINGPLYYERMGRTGPVMAFVHPNPMDQSCWIYQMARFSTWFRCVAIDIPGYGRSPAGNAEMSRFDMAQALWETLDEIYRGEPAVLVGCSVGASLVPHMYKLRPKQTKAMIVCGTGYRGPDEVSPHIQFYKDNGLSYRWDFTSSRGAAIARHKAGNVVGEHALGVVLRRITDHLPGVGDAPA